MLSLRATALSAKDVKGYLQPVTGPAKDFESMLANRALAAPLSDIDLEAEQPVVADGGPTIAGVRVEFTYGYQGLPRDNRFRLPLVYTVEKISTGWTVVQSAVAQGESLPVWAGGEILTKRSEHFLEIFRPGLNGADKLLDLAEQARTRLATKVAAPLEPAQLIIAAKDSEQYRQIAGPQQFSSVAQAQSAEAVGPHSIKILGRQIIVDKELLDQEPNGVEVLQHELAHLALAAQTRTFSPVWLRESAAIYLSGARPTALWAQGLAHGDFAALSLQGIQNPHDLNSGARGGLVSFQYAYAAAAADYLIETFGADKYWQLYRSYSEVPADQVYRQIPDQNADKQTAQDKLATFGATLTNQALNKIYGLDLATLDAKVKAWLPTAAR